MNQIKIFVVEDEAIIAKDLQFRLEDMGYSVPLIIATGKEAINKAIEHKPDLILMDILLPGEMDGIEAAEQILSNSNVPIIYLTSYVEKEILNRAEKTSAYGYLVKPVADKDLRDNIEITLRRHNINRS